MPFSEETSYSYTDCFTKVNVVQSGNTLCLYEEGYVQPYILSFLFLCVVLCSIFWEINPLQRNRDNEVHLLWKRYAAWRNRHAGSFSDVVPQESLKKSRLSKIIFEGG